jgi:hypothetical protein
MRKIEVLAEIHGLDVMEMLEQATMDSICPGICANKGCNYTTDVEPDCRGGYCEECGTQTVRSALVLAGMI